MAISTIICVSEKFIVFLTLYLLPDDLATKKVMLLNFYADWCRYSSLLKPIYDKAADQIQSETVRLLLGFHHVCNSLFLFCRIWQFWVKSIVKLKVSFYQALVNYYGCLLCYFCPFSLSFFL